MTFLEWPTSLRIRFVMAIVQTHSGWVQSSKTESYPKKIIEIDRESAAANIEVSLKCPTGKCFHVSVLISVGPLDSLVTHVSLYKKSCAFKPMYESALEHEKQNKSERKLTR